MMTAMMIMSGVVSLRRRAAVTTVEEFEPCMAVWLVSAELIAGRDGVDLIEVVVTLLADDAGFEARSFASSAPAGKLGMTALGDDIPRVEAAKRPESVSRFRRLRSARSSAADWQRTSRSFSSAL